MSRLQPKLTVSGPRNRWEDNADRIASEVMTRSEAGVSARSLAVHPLTATPESIGDAPVSVERVLSNGGAPLEAGVRSDMERRFGYDFSHVKIHADADARQSADDINALAYTVGSHIVFADPGSFGSDDRRRLLAHELTHVVQQAGARQDTISREPKKPPPFTADAQDVAFLQNRMLALYNSLSTPVRASLQRNSTIAIALVTDPDGRPTMVITAASNKYRTEILNAAESLGLTQWTERGRAEGRSGSPTGKQLRRPAGSPVGTVPKGKGAPNDAEQLLIEGAENNRFKIHAVAVSRAVCVDCQEALADYQKRVQSIHVNHVPDPKAAEMREYLEKKPGAKGGKQGSGTKPSTKPSTKGPRSRTRPPKPPKGGGGGSKVAVMTSQAANRMVNTSLQLAQHKLMKLATENAKDKEVVEVIDTTNKVLDVKNFVENPTRFAAQQIKTEMTQAVFRHFSEVLAKARQKFDEEFPTVDSLRADPLTTGTTLEQFQQKYQQAVAALRLPDARKTLLYAFAVLGLPDNAPADVIEARLRQADEILKKTPGIGTYVKEYSRAQAGYVLALDKTRDDIEKANAALTGRAELIAKELKWRGDVLAEAADTLYDVADDLFYVPFPGFAEAAWELTGLADGFQSLSEGFRNFGSQAEYRQRSYAAALSAVRAELARAKASPHAAMTRATP